MELSKRLVNSLLEPVDREEERFFRLKSVLTSIWVPCVVGDKNQNASMFFKSGLTSTTSKHFGVLIAIFVYKFKIYVPASLQFSSILFFCQDKATLDQNMTNTCQGWSECFNSSSTDLQQKIRLCGGGRELEELVLHHPLLFLRLLRRRHHLLERALRLQGDL